MCAYDIEHIMNPQAVLEASPCTVDSPYTPTSLQHSTTALQRELGSYSASFATAQTIDSCADYLEPVLRDLGIKQWQLHHGDPTAVLNSLYEMVQRLQDMMHNKEQLQEEMQKLKVDAKTADRTIQRLQCQSDQKAQEAGGLNIKLRQLDAWYREEADRWNGEREQMGKKGAQLEQRHVQFQHELRRRDAEFEKLQKQLASYLSGSKRGAGSNSSTTAATGRITTRSRNGTVTSSSRAAPSAPSDLRRVSKAELEEMHKRVVEAYEADKQELLQECTALQKVLQSLEREHKELLNKVDQGPPVSAMHSSPSPDISSGDVQAAVVDPSGTLQQMQAKLEAMKVRKQRITGAGLGMDLQELQQHANTPNERLLMAKLLEAGKIMEEQETTLIMALKALPHARVRA